MNFLYSLHVRLPWERNWQFVKAFALKREAVRYMTAPEFYRRIRKWRPV
jgi:hypothetical protein